MRFSVLGTHCGAAGPRKAASSAMIRLPPSVSAPALVPSTATPPSTRPRRSQRWCACGCPSRLLWGLPRLLAAAQAPAPVAGYAVAGGCRIAAGGAGPASIRADRRERGLGAPVGSPHPHGRPRSLRGARTAVAPLHDVARNRLCRIGPPGRRPPVEGRILVSDNAAGYEFRCQCARSLQPCAAPSRQRLC